MTPEEVLADISRAKKELQFFEYPSYRLEASPLINVACSNSDYCAQCTRCVSCIHCRSCFDCSFCRYCVSCVNCSFCIGIHYGVNLKFVAWGIQFTEAQYIEFVQKMYGAK